MRRTVYTIAFSGDEFLMVYNHKRNGWEMPGGGVRDDETIEDAAIREYREEAGYDIRIISSWDIAGCSVCAAVLGERTDDGEMETKLFRELPEDLAFGRSEYEGVMERARSLIGKK